MGWSASFKSIGEIRNLLEHEENVKESFNILGLNSDTDNTNGSTQSVLIKLNGSLGQSSPLGN